jgi:hypothetical protein
MQGGRGRVSIHRIAVLEYVVKSTAWKISWSHFPLNKLTNQKPKAKVLTPPPPPRCRGGGAPWRGKRGQRQRHLDRRFLFLSQTARGHGLLSRWGGGGGGLIPPEWKPPQMTGRRGGGEGGYRFACSLTP